MKTRKQIRYLRRKALKNLDNAKAIFLKIILKDKSDEEKLLSLLEAIKQASYNKNKQYLRYKGYIEEILGRGINEWTWSLGNSIL